MAVTEKISVALGRDELRLARRAAARDGVSLSAFLTGAVRARLAERQRLEAARQVLAGFEPDDWPTVEEEAALLSFWSTSRVSGRPRRRRRQ
jgi:hypothetical protein